MTGRKPIQTVLPIVMLIAISGAVFFCNLGAVRLWDRDEPRNAGCAAEMLARGDWIIPTFNDQLRHQKPVLLYWLIMSAYSAFGVGEFGARFWSATLSVGTVVLTYAIGTRLFNRRIGILSAIILCSSLLFCLAARAATPDAVLIFCMTLGFYFFVRFGFSPGDAPEREATFVGFPGKGWQWALIYFSLGLGLLAKGPIGFVLPMAVIGLYLLLTNRRAMANPEVPGMGFLARVFLEVVAVFHPRNFSLALGEMHWLKGLACIFLVGAPWYFLVGLGTEGEFLQKFFLDEHLGRATSTLENHSGGLWFYPLALLVGMFPWSIFAVPVMLECDRWVTSQWRPGTVFLLCWFGLQVCLFSFVQTKLPSYVTPCYPAVSILFAASLIRFQGGQAQALVRWFQTGFAVLLPAAIALAAGLYLASQRYLDGHWELVCLVVPLLIGAPAVWWISLHSSKLALNVFAAMAVVFCGGLFGWGTVAVDSLRETDVVLRPIRDADEHVAVAAYHCLESSWVFYSGRAIIELQDESSGFDSVYKPTAWHPWPRLAPEEFSRLYRDSLILTTDEHLSALLRRLPEGFQELSRCRYFLRGEDLVLVGRNRQFSTASKESKVPH